MSPSNVWAFSKKGDDGKSVECIKCGRKFSSPSTSTMRYHLTQVHNMFSLQPGSSKRKLGLQEATDPENEDSTSQNADGQQSDASGKRSTAEGESNNFQGPLDKCLASAKSFSRGGHRDKHATNAMLFMIARDDMPLRTPEREGFRVFCRALQPLYSVPSEPTCTKGLRQRFLELRAAYGKKLANAKSVGLTLDLWTHSDTMESYLGVTAHYRDETEKNKRLRSIELGVKHIPERKKSENIAAAIREICLDWQISTEKVQGVVTDGGANVKAAARLVFDKEKHIICAGHLINTIGQTILGMESTSIPSEAAPGELLNEPENEDDAEALLEDVTEEPQQTTELSVRSLLMEVKLIVRFFRSSEVASEELKQQQIRAGSTRATCLKLIQEVRTRWNSGYYMLKRYLDLEEHVTAVLLKLQRERGCTKRRPPSIITGEKVSLLIEVKNLLKPLEEATNMLSKEKDVTLSNVIPIIYGLRTDINAYQPTELLAFNIKQKLEAEIHSKFSGIELLRPYAAATFLDPRYKNFVFENPHAVSNIISSGVSEMIRESSCAFALDTAPEVEGGGSSSGIWSAVDSLLRRSSAGALNQDATGAVPLQLKAYLNSAVIDRRTNPDPLEVWDSMKIGHEQLYELAMLYLPLMPTSTAAERLFSHAGSVKYTRRNRLSPANLNILVFLRSVSEEDWFSSFH